MGFIMISTYHNTRISTYHDNEAAQNAADDEVKTKPSYSNTLRHLGRVSLL